MSLRNKELTQEEINNFKKILTEHCVEEIERIFMRVLNNSFIAPIDPKDWKIIQGSSK